MKVTQRPRQYLKLSSRKAAVVDFDTIIAYVLFTSTIILLVNYSLGVTSPFATSIDILSNEKNTITVRDMVKTDFLVSDLESLCIVSYVNMRLLSVEYEVKSFEMPLNDAINFSANTINGSVVFYRNGNELRVITGSSDQSYLITVKVIVSSSPCVTNLTLDSGDSFNIQTDSFNNFMITINSTVSNGDLDEVIIKPVTGLVSFEITGVDLSNCFIGNLSIQDHCGRVGVTGRKTSFNRYGAMTDGRSDYGVKLTGDIWWTN